MALVALAGCLVSLVALVGSGTLGGEEVVKQEGPPDTVVVVDAEC